MSLDQGLRVGKEALRGFPPLRNLGKIGLRLLPDVTVSFVSRINGIRGNPGRLAILHVYQHPLPRYRWRGVRNRHHWDEELRNYDTDEDVFNEIRWNAAFNQPIFLVQTFLSPCILPADQLAMSEMKWENEKHAL